MNRSPNPSPLPPDRQEAVARILDRFRKAWSGVKDPAEVVDLKEFLPDPSSPERSATLHGLIQIDLENRYRSGQSALLDRYLETFPELGSCATVSAKLVLEEYQIRQQFGDKPDISQYQSRFPTQFPELQRLLHDGPLDTLKAPPPSDVVQTKAADKPLLVPPAKSQANVSQLGEYKLVKRIGRGGFGEVWQAEAPGGVEVAVKVIFRSLEDEDAQRELQSLELIKRLRHPYLLQTQAFYSLEDRLRIVMELADGSLRDRIKECRKAGLTGVPLKELLTYFREAAEALDYLHGEGVLHRDIKPENILLLKRHAKLADFGLARFHDQQRSVTASGSGTPAYMPPEVWKGKVSKLSDQYSLAVTYAELRLDRRPFSGDMAQIIFEHLERKPDLAPLPEAEQQVILKALAKDPYQRYGSCLEFIQALDIAAGPSGVVSPHSPASSGERKTEPEPASLQEAPGGLGTLGRDQRALGVQQTNLNAPIVSGTAVDGAVVAPGQKPSDWRKAEASATGPAGLTATPPRRKQSGRWVVLVVVGLFTVGMLGAWWIFRGPRGGNGEVDFLPADSFKAEGAEIVQAQGKKYYSRIERVLPNGRRVFFLLIPKLRTTDPETFYIMRDKVSVGEFKEFAAKFQAIMKDDRWKQGGPKGGKDAGAANAEIPVFSVVVDDAYLFASKWMGGNLPTIKEWDKAAGRFEDGAGDGPFASDWKKETDKDKSQIAINRGKEGPLPVGRADKDVSFFGVRDMAGNGREFTRELFAPVGNEHSVPLLRTANPISDRVILRGRSFREPAPLKFNDPRLNDRPDAAAYAEAEPDIGFRVVLEPPGN